MNKAATEYNVRRNGKYVLRNRRKLENLINKNDKVINENKNKVEKTQTLQKNKLVVRQKKIFYKINWKRMKN